MNNKPVFALVDCNNFFVSCERVFAPHLENKAVVVLSNNDGCAIARSNEAKALNIAMGEPFYRFKHLYEKKKLDVLSSNFHLYSNMSWRIMESLKALCPFVEVYSVDEAFLGLQALNIEDYEAFGQDIKQKLNQWVGIPVSVGIAPTKTLAKIANHISKKSKGVCILLNNPNLNTILEKFQVEDIWGIGRKLAPKLRLLGIGNARELRDSDPLSMRKKFSIVVERIIHELNGISCLELTTLHEDKQSITSSRSFGRPVTAIEELEEALSNYISSACIKLRKQNSRANEICVFLSTNIFSSKQSQYRNSLLCPLPHPSNNTGEIIHYAKKALHQIFKPTYQYHKLGVILTNLQSTKIQQMQLFNRPDYLQSDKLMRAIDSINKNMGKNTVFLASQGTERTWEMMSQKKSPEFTTNWADLPIVK